VMAGMFRWSPGSCIIPSGCCWNGEWASETRIRPLVQHPASSSIVHPASLCAVSLHFLRLIRNNPLWILLSIWQPTRPHWLPLCDRQIWLCFNSTIQFYRQRSSQISAKTTPLTDCFGNETQQKQSSTAIKTSPQSQLALGMAMKQ
jgi:hypothetical protein